MNSNIARNQSESITRWGPPPGIRVTGTNTAKSLNDLFDNIKNPASAAYTGSDSTEADLNEALRRSSAGFKTLASRVSMHLGLPWLQRLFNQIDSLLDFEEWDPRDPAPTQDTARTFLRLLLVLNVGRKPGLGVSNSGNLVAAWTAEQNRLTIESLPNDRVRWVVSRLRNGEVERAAGEGRIERLKDFLAPYDPSVWFEYDE